MKRRDFLKTTALIPFVGVTALPETTQASVPAKNTKKIWCKYTLDLTHTFVMKMDWNGYRKTLEENAYWGELSNDIDKAMSIAFMKRIKELLPFLSLDFEMIQVRYEANLPIMTDERGAAYDPPIPIGHPRFTLTVLGTKEYTPDEFQIDYQRFTQFDIYGDCGYVVMDVVFSPTELKI